VSEAAGVRGEQVLGKAYDARLMARVWVFIRPHWKLLLLASLLIPLSVAFELAQPYILKQAIDLNIAAHNTDGLGTRALMYVSCVGLQALTGFAQLYSLQLLGQRSMHDLRQVTYRHVIRMRSGFYDTVPVGRLLTRMTNDVESINEMFASGVVTLVADIVKLIAIVAMMLVLNVKMALITFCTLPLLMLLVIWARKIMRTSFRQIRVKLAAMNAYVQEHLSGIKVVQLFCRERPAADAYDEINGAHRDAYLGAIRADAGMYAVVEAIGVGSGALIAWYAGANIAEGALTVGLVVAFIEYVNKFFIPVRDLSAKYTVMQSAMAAAERIVNLLDTEEPDAPLSDRSVEAKANAPAVEFDNVRFAYRKGEEVLKGVSLEVERGQTVAVVGATGSGKSTLIRLLARLYEPNFGAIYVDGIDITTTPADDLRKRITVVSQDVFLFSGTVGDNVRLGKLDATKAELEAALAKVGADRMLARRKAGLDEKVAERGGNFSAGERQLVSFARALIRDPDILILDEATAHVDPQTEAAIEAGLAALMGGRTTLVIAHRLSTIRNADRIVVMSKGTIAEHGTHDELVAFDGLYAKLERTFSHN
jgi:ATP-binding cassette subfamily B protein